MEEEKKETTVEEPKEANLEEKKVIRQFTDETREVYRLNVDLFRRWWYMHHRDLALEFSL